MRIFHFVIISCLLVVSCTSEQASDTPSQKGTVSQDSVSASLSPQNAESFSRSSSSIGQMIYVPVYSHIYQQDRQKTFNLTTTLSFRNTDPYRSLTLTEVSYYDLDGNLVQQYLDDSLKLKPLASTSFVVEERDLRGGVGANFIVQWRSDQPVTPPVVEAIMISTSQQQGISFLSTGRVLQENQPAQPTNSGN